MAELKWYNAYDDLSVAVYIIDAVSYELLYLNNRVKSLFPNSALGSPCFSTFKDNTECCEDCPLLPNTDGFTGDFFYLRQRKFPSSSGNLFDVYEGIINWETNRQVCFCVLVDSDSKTELEQLNSTILPSLYMHKLSSQLETVQSLENALSVQEFISNFTHPFTQPHTNFNALIYDAMAALKQYLHADRVYILTMDSETNNLHYLYRLTEDNIATYPNSFAMSLADFAIIESIFEKKSFAYFNDLKTENANIASFFKEAISAIFTPILIDGKIEGCMHFSTIDSPANWNHLDFQIIESAASIISGAIAENRTKKKLALANNRLAVALSSSKTGVFEMSVKNQTMDFDDTIKELLQVPWDTPIPLTQWADYIGTIINPIKNKQFLRYLYNFDGKKPVNFLERKYIFPDGIKYMNASSTICYDDDGVPERIIGMLNDVTDAVVERNTHNDLIEKQIRSQEFISVFSVPFTQPINIDLLMEDALDQLQSYFHTDRICIQLLAAEKQAVTCKYEKLSSSKAPSLLGSSIPLSDISMLTKMLRYSPYIYYENTDELFEDVPQVNYGAISSLLMPMVCDGNLLGYLIFDVLWDDILWDDSDLQLAQLASSVISGAYHTHNTQQALKEAVIEAQTANSAKSNFLSRMSHELRTPMNAIIGMTRIAKESSDIQKKNSCLNEIDASSTQLLDIINDVLDLSKIESGKFDLHYDPIAFDEIIKKNCSLFAEKISKSHLKLNYISGNALKIYYLGDNMRISQVIANLISNAVKFTPANGTITISADEISFRDNISYVKLSVKDNGIGMTSDQLRRIFDSFEQADTTITRRYGGTGLGLSICKNLIEKMNGKIEVISELNKGSEFIVTLPLIPALEHENNVISNAKDRTSGTKLLLVTSNANILSSFKKICKIMSWELRVFITYSELKNYSKLAYYNFIFIDTEIEGFDPDHYSSMKKTDSHTSTILISNSMECVEVYETDASKVLLIPITPLAIFDIVTDGILPPNLSKADVKTYDFSGINILLAEDIELNRAILVSLLADTRIGIDEAENGLVAVDMFRKNPDKYDLIFMDLHMPEMNGLDATRVIRNLAIDKATSIPIIALTASAYKEDVNACREAGMNEHIAKPIDINLVTEKIYEYTKDK